MDFSSASKQASEMLGGLKDKLGFKSGQESYDSYNDSAEDDYYDEYSEYAPDGYDYYDEPYGSDYRDNQSYGSNAGYLTRSAYTAPALVTPAEARVSAHNYGVTRDSFAATSVMPKVEEEPASTEPVDPGFDVPATAPRDFVSPYKKAAATTTAAAFTTAQANTTMFSAVGQGVNSTASYAVSSDSATTTHSAGLNSLFAATTDTAADAATAAASVAASTPDPFEAFENHGDFSHHPARELTVIKPYTYEDVSSVARAVRAGDAVVLSLRSTDPALAKRVLDFSFGVASALDAQVDCPADKVFVIIKGKELTLDERHRLHQQAIL